MTTRIDAINAAKTNAKIAQLTGNQQLLADGILSRLAANALATVDGVKIYALWDLNNAAQKAGKPPSHTRGEVDSVADIVSAALLASGYVEH